MEQSVTSLQKTQSGTLSHQKSIITVGDLEQAMLKIFPAKDACDWDYTGMFVGNPAAPIEGVAVALDPSIASMRAALDANANVLVTHHPVFLDAPTSFLPASVQGATAGAAVHFALTHGLSCMAFHTACDASVKGLAALPGLLRLSIKSVLEPYDYDHAKGFGQVCSVGEACTLQQLSARCVSVLESHPRVWGNPDKIISSVVTCGGSAGSVIQSCLDQNIDCLICGELKYHDALWAYESGLCIIELGHDVSENPLVALLASAVVASGVPEEKISLQKNVPHWYIPEALRR